jgi:hypothetical protein
MSPRDAWFVGSTAADLTSNSNRRRIE